jgi:NADPH:quinone reductase-like Zn-dependent oxidoreductase
MSSHTHSKAWFVAGRFGLDALTLGERPTPVPGPHQVLVRVRAAALNYRDLRVVDGTYAPDQPLPLVPVSDGAGEVVALGAGVTRVQVGDRVAGAFAQRWIAGEPPSSLIGGSTLGAPRDGVLAEHVVLDEDGTVRIPDHLDWAEAATLPIAGVTAWNALAGVVPGATVVVQGTGGVAVFAVQLAKAAGARVIVTSRSDDKLERVRALGADDLVNSERTPAWHQRVLALTGGAGADIVVEIGGASLDRSVDALRAGGRIALIGLLGGATAALPVIPALVKRARIHGIQVGSRDDFEALNRAVAHHRLRPVIDRTVPFDQAPAAFRALAEARHVGKIVIAGA